MPIKTNCQKCENPICLNARVSQRLNNFDAAGKPGRNVGLPLNSAATGDNQNPFGEFLIEIEVLTGPQAHRHMSLTATTITEHLSHVSL